jgi:peptide/nickel transport system permease protein
VQFVAVQWKWLPPLGYTKFSESPTEWLRYITLPAIALGVAISAAYIRQRCARRRADTNPSARVGHRRSRVVGRHGLKNVLAAITIVGLQSRCRR